MDCCVKSGRKESFLRLSCEGKISCSSYWFVVAKYNSLQLGMKDSNELNKYFVTVLKMFEIG